MENVFVYLIDMPGKIRESVVPCVDGYTVYIDNKISQPEQEKAYLHAMAHIAENDFEKESADEIEAERHK